MDGHASSSDLDMDMTHGKTLDGDLGKNVEVVATQLKDHVRDLEENQNHLEQGIMISRESEEKMKEETKFIEAKAMEESFLFKRLKMTDDLEKRDAELEEAIVFGEHASTNIIIEQQKETLDLRSQMSIEEINLWVEKAASLLKEHVESIRELRGGYRDSSTTNMNLGKEEKEALQANLEELHLKFRDVQLYNGFGALELCKELLSLEQDCLNMKMLDIAYKNTNFKNDLEVLKSQIQNLKNLSFKEMKKSFQEVTVNGEIQSLKLQLIELQSLKAQASQIPSLQVHIAQLQQAAETRERQQNLELVKMQRKVSSAEEELSLLKSTLLNQTHIDELKEQVDLLVQNVMKLEESNASLKEEINKSKVNLEAEVLDKVIDEDVLEQQDDILQPQYIKPKTQKRKNRKSRKVPILQKTTQIANRICSFKHLILVFLFLTSFVGFYSFLFQL